MRNKTRQLVAAGAVCLAMALIETSAVAGVNRWTAIGPDGVNVAALIDTRYGAFAGTMGAGVLKSTDSGTSWAPVNQGLPTTNVRALAIDPSAPYLYAGTAVGVFKSTDRGQSWVAVNAGLPNASVVSVNALAI